MSSEQSLREFKSLITEVSERRLPRGKTVRVIGRTIPNQRTPPGVVRSLSRDQVRNILASNNPLGTDVALTRNYEVYPEALWVAFDLEEEEENEFGPVSP